MRRRIVPLLALLAIACARATSTGTGAAPAPTVSTRAIPAPLPPGPNIPTDTNAARLARNWHLLDLETDKVPGISAERALREVLATRQPRRTVIVAVIDGGTDTAHADLRANLWGNARETPGNRVDDDANGYADDLRGWNFIGGRDGRNVEHDTYEMARIHAGCRKRAPDGNIGALPAADFTLCNRVATAYEKEMQEMSGMLPALQQMSGLVSQVMSVLRTALRTDAITDSAVAALRPANQDVAQAQALYARLAQQGITPAEIERASKEVRSRVDFGLSLTFDPRPIVGDDTTNIREKGYGNSDVAGPDASHGTHVAGIIGAVRGNGAGMDGIAPAVRILTVRAVPNGDERDKDIANAIRYAVDNGAQIINMSFGKAFSPGKAVVDEAVKYADSRGVLMVHGAGNDGENNDSTDVFPNPRYLSGGRAAHWIEVGASSWRGGKELPADFSNFGRAEVDVFAPGVDIYSTMPGGKYDKQSGTSMAAPVVSGAAALLMAYYPELTALEIKRILVNSASRHPEQLVERPGSATGEVVFFGSLSATGGIVNVLNAARMAEQVVRK
jgi:subtilisin family serine protease